MRRFLLGNISNLRTKTSSDLGDQNCLPEFLPFPARWFKKRIEAEAKALPSSVAPWPLAPFLGIGKALHVLQPACRKGWLSRGKERGSREGILRRSAVRW